MSAPPVPVVTPPELPASETRVCANCGAPLTGEYCAACGQRHEPHIHTVKHFASEAFEAISHADSRLWQTLWLLLVRPGRLTKEFFEGRRVRYLPPFRLYLVLSVLLVVVSSIASRSDAPEPADTVNKAPAAPAATAPAATARDAPAQDDTQPSAPPDTEPTIGTRLAEAADAPPGQKPNVIQIDGLDDFCARFDDPEAGGGNVGARRNIKRFCTRIRTVPGELAEVVVASIPRAMFVFLPLIAAFMKLLYWRPKRYYVEHLLFLVHNHAAVFLVYILVGLYAMIPVLGAFTPLVFFFGLLYLAWYVHRAMRVFYGQGRLLTFSKYFLLLWTYVITAFAGFIITLIIVAVWG